MQGTRDLSRTDGPKKNRRTRPKSKPEMGPLSRIIGVFEGPEDMSKSIDEDVYR
jgi:hypothetical protein